MICQNYGILFSKVFAGTKNFIRKGAQIIMKENFNHKNSNKISFKCSVLPPVEYREHILRLFLHSSNISLDYCKRNLI